MSFKGLEVIIAYILLFKHFLLVLSFVLLNKTIIVILIIYARFDVRADFESNHVPVCN